MFVFSEINLISQEPVKKLIKEVNEKLAEEILPEFQKILFPLMKKIAGKLEIETHEHCREKVLLITIDSPIDVASSGNNTSNSSANFK